MRAEIYEEKKKGKNDPPLKERGVSETWKRFETILNLQFWSVRYVSLPTAVLVCQPFSQHDLQNNHFWTKDAKRLKSVQVGFLWCSLNTLHLQFLKSLFNLLNSSKTTLKISKKLLRKTILPNQAEVAGLIAYTDFLWVKESKYNSNAMPLFASSESTEPLVVISYRTRSRTM